MNTIKIYLSSSGSLAELEKDFPIYQGAFNATLLNVYVPTSLLLGTGDIQYVDGTGFVHTTPDVFTALKIGMVSIGRDGRIDKTKAYYMRYIEKLEYQGVEYALYERALPQAFTLFEGQDSQAPKLIINVVNMKNNNEYNGEEIIVREPTIIQVITSQQCSLDVLPSANFDIDEFIEPSEWDVVNGYIDDLYEKYDYIVNNIDETIENYTYDKDTIDQKDTDTLQLAKDYADENFYNETESDARFVKLTGDETIGGTKTFTQSPNVPNASADMHATNREDLQDYTYSKAEIGNLTQPISFETEQNFLDWLAGSFSRPDGILPSDLLLGKKIIIKETNKNNYQVASVPALTLADYKILVEDTKALEEIIARPYKNIAATDGQEFVEDLKDEIDLKTQIVSLGILTIEPNEWQIDGDKFSYEYTNENYTDSLIQSLKFINNTVSQSEQIIDEGIAFLGFEDTTDGVKLIINKEPSFNLSFEVMLLTYTDITITPEELVASMVGFDNTGTGLSAVNVQQALNEIKGLVDTVPQTFDKIITTQAEFAAMLASPNWLGAKRVAIVSMGLNSYTSFAIKVPSGVQTVQGFGNPTIEVSASASNTDGNITSSTSIKGITFFFHSTSSGSIVLFKGLTALSEIVVRFVIGGLYPSNVTVFEDCNNLKDITIYAPNGLSSYKTINGFKNCNYISNAKVTYLNNTIGVGFENCSSLVNCLVRADGVVTGTGYKDCSFGSNNRSENLSLNTSGTMIEWSSEKVDKSSIVQTLGSSTTDVISQKSVSDELDLKADKSDFQGTAGDIFYVNAVGELDKLPKSNNSFLGVSNSGEVEWVKTTNITSPPYGVYQAEVAESGDVETTSQFYKDGFRKYYIVNPASGQPSFPIVMNGLVSVGFTNEQDVPLFSSVVLDTEVHEHSHATAYGISAVSDLTNVPNKYLIMRDSGSLVVMSTEETSIASYLEIAFIVNYNATTSL